MTRIGFIGLGTMGEPMATNLLKNGYSLMVYNRTPSKADELVHLGAELAASPAEVAKETDVLFTNVSNDQALLSVVLGLNGVLEGAHPGLTVIDCSTVSPETSRLMARELESHGGDFLDAPVTGSRPAAEAGTLVFMIGGKEEVLQQQQELFEALGSRTVYMGPSGSGSYAKLAHNAMVGINAAGVAEGMSLAAKAGIDPEKFLEVVLHGGAGSKQAELKGQKIINRNFDAQFSLELMLKDLLLASGIAGRFQLPTPMLHNATSLFQMGLSKGLGSQDLCSVVQCYEDWMGQQVVKPASSAQAATESTASASERRRNNRISLDIKLQLSVYQWEQEGSFSGQTIDATLHDLSESGLQVISNFPLANDMFVVIHFPQEADLPPIIAKIIRIEYKENAYRYGCMMAGMPPYVRLKLEEYIRKQEKTQGLS